MLYEEEPIDSEIARMFYQENQEKKNIGRNIYHRSATRKGRINKMMFPSDFLSPKDKRKYKKCGEVTRYNMYDDIKGIPRFEEIEKMDKDSARNLILNLKEKHSIKALCKEWGMSNYNFYHGVVPKYDIPTQASNREGTGKNQKNNKKNNKVIVKTNPSPTPDEIAVTTHENNVVPINQYTAVPLMEEKEFEGFKIQFGGKYSGEKLSERILNYIATLDKETFYKIKFVIEEQNAI